MHSSVRVGQPVCACAYLVDLGLLIIPGFQEKEDLKTFYVLFTLPNFPTVYKRKD